MSAPNEIGECAARVGSDERTSTAGEILCAHGSTLGVLTDQAVRACVAPSFVERHSHPRVPIATDR